MLFYNSFDPPYFVPTYYQFTTSNLYPQTIMTELTYQAHNYFSHINCSSPRLNACSSLWKTDPNRVTYWLYACFRRQSNLLVYLRWYIRHMVHSSKSQILLQQHKCEYVDETAKSPEIMKGNCMSSVTDIAHIEHRSVQLRCFLNKFKPSGFASPLQNLRTRFEYSARLTKTNFHFRYTHLVHPFPVLSILISRIHTSWREIYCSKR